MSDPTEFDPAAALATLHDTRAAWATRPGAKVWRYDFIYGLIVGAMVGGQALPVPFNALSSLGGAAVIGLMALYWARRCGVWIGGTGPRRARWVAVGFGTLFILAAVGVFWAATKGMAWVGWPAGVVAALVGMLAARLWRWVYRSDVADATDMLTSGIGHRPYGLLAAFGAVILIVTGGVAYVMQAFDSAWFFYALGAGVGVISVSLLMVVVRALFLRPGR